jgi:hypothetical protein
MQVEGNAGHRHAGQERTKVNKMKNAMLRVGYTCASILIAGALTITAGKAEVRDLANVNFTQPVTVGTTTLPEGHYTISNVSEGVFLIHSDNGEHAIVLGKTVDTLSEAPKTEVLLKNDGEGFRLDKLVFGGETSGIGFNK